MRISSRFFLRSPWRATALAFLIIPSLSVKGLCGENSARNARPVQVVLQNVPMEDAAVKLALDALESALRARGWRADIGEQPNPGSRRIIITGTGGFQNDRTASSQSFKIEPSPEGLQVSSPGIGLVYGIFRLAEFIRRDGLAWSLHREETPAFAERIFSYEGTLLDLPDEGYYFRQPPWVNEPLLQQQIEEAKSSMRRLLASGFNSIAFLNLNVEDYVNYGLLGNGERVYPPDSLHRIRAQIFCRALSELSDYAHQLHMQLFLQIYELSLPDHMDGRQLTDESGATWELVDAKFRELFERTTLDGIILTLTEPSPRMAYRGTTLWKTPEGAGRMAAHYHDTIVKKMHRRLIVRMWWVTDTMEGFRRVLSGAPDADIMFDTKNTQGDFFLSVGENHLIGEGAPGLRPFSVTFDVFRQFDGWGMVLFYPQSWAARFKDAKASGAVAVNAWGPWNAGCIFPGIWAGKYDYYDFLQHGFRPALASLDLFSRLAWNPDEPLDNILRDWGIQNFGRENTPALKKALLLSSDLWTKTYLGPDDQGVFKWSMVFQPIKSPPTGFFQSHSLAELRESNKQALSLALEIHKLVYSMDPTHAPQPNAVYEFRRAADLTLLYFKTFTVWRELMWQDHEWEAGNRRAATRADLLRLATELRGLLPQWRQFPREAKDWFVFQFDPEMNTAPTWMTRTSVMETVAAIQQKLKTTP